VPCFSTVEFSLKKSGWSYEQISKYEAYVQRRMLIKRTGRSAFSDSQKNKVYSAEHAFEAKFQSTVRKFKQFSDYNEAEKYLKKVLASKTWQKLTDRTNITLIEKRDMGNRSRTAGVAYYNKIQLCPRYGMNEYVLLHELAHCAGHMHHDVSFRKTLLKLVSRFIGIEAAAMLKAEFKSKNLKMARKSTVLTPEQWIASVEKIKIMKKTVD
jgi:putative metallohydrolase (TIGR04338 family)